MKVAIVCGSPSSEYLYPKSGWEIWVLGNRIDRHDHADRIFEIHDNLHEHGDPRGYAKFLASKNIPLVVGEQFPLRGDNIEVFPYQEASDLYGSLYLTSSPAYMMAYALLHGATEIGVYGVDLSVDDHEYFWQRPCMEAWIGFARGRGVKVTIPEVSHVGKCDYVEGRDWNGKREFGNPPFTEAEFRLMSEEHQKKIAGIRAQIAQLEATIAAHDGAMQAYNRLAKVARATEAGITVKSLLETSVIRG